MGKDPVLVWCRLLNITNTHKVRVNTSSVQLCLIRYTQKKDEYRVVSLGNAGKRTAGGCGIDRVLRTPVHRHVYLPHVYRAMWVLWLNGEGAGCHLDTAWNLTGAGQCPPVFSLSTGF